MKKKWVELKRGVIVEVSAVRHISAGDTQESLDTAKFLYVGFVGEKTKHTFTFESNDAKWKAYTALHDALIETEEDDGK